MIYKRRDLRYKEIFRGSYMEFAMRVEYKPIMLDVMSKLE